MAGGIWTAQNKIRPGAYINFKSVPEPMTKLGTRGIMTMPLALDWGDTIFELLSTDLLNGKSLAKIGYTAFDPEAQIFREALKGTYKAIIYRLDTGGLKAKVTIGNLTANAKYSGICGNNIKVAVIANGSSFYVVTFYNNVEKDRQLVSAISDLVDNDFVTFDGTGSLTANAGVALTGGTNGTISTSSAYSDYLSKMSTKTFNTMAIPTNDTTVIPNIVTFIKNLRDNQGIKAQAVVYNYPNANHEGIISSICGYENEKTGEVVSPTTFVATIAGLTAGATIKDSLTNFEIEGATKIINELDDEGIKTAIQAGNLVLSKRQNGIIKIETDINTFTSFTPDKSRDFSKNKIIRTLDEVNNSLKSIWENGYEGKVDNDDAGRKVYKGDGLHYLGILQGIHAVQNLDPENDLDVQQGDDKDAVVALVGVEPVDAMEKMYMTVNVR